MAYRWTGSIARGSAPGTLVGVLRDGMGYEITLTGTKGEHGYEVTGVPGPVPAEYAIPLLDDEEA